MSSDVALSSYSYTIQYNKFIGSSLSGFSELIYKQLGQITIKITTLTITMTRMIIGRIGLHSVLLPVIINAQRAKQRFIFLRQRKTSIRLTALVCN